VSRRVPFYIAPSLRRYQYTAWRTEAHVCEQLAQGRYVQRSGRGGFEYATYLLRV